jgi:serine protease
MDLHVELFHFPFTYSGGISHGFAATGQSDLRVHVCNRTMKRFTPLPLLLAFAAMANAQSPAPTIARTEAEVVAHRVIVKLADPTTDPASALEHRLAALGGQFGRISVRSWLSPALVARSGGLHKGFDQHRGLERILLVEYTAEIDPRVVALKLSGIEGLAYAEPEYRRELFGVPNDPQVARQWYLDRIRAFDAWEEHRTDSSTVIAIVDTGIDWMHPDLAAAVWRNHGETGRDGQGADRRSNGVDDDANGFIDDWIGYDFAGRDARSTDNDPSPGHWHGTHVAGIAAAATDNGIGIAGIARGARVMALKIANDNRNEATLVNGYDALLYAARMGATVINCSWGGGGRMLAEQDVIDAVTDAGTLVVAAAGNDGRQSATYPASYRGVLSVASVMAADKRSLFSNYNVNVGISAPGDEIFSTLPTSQSPTGYGLADGTSMSAPMVAGAAALVRSRFPSLDPAQVSAVLRATADNIDEQNPDYHLLLGAGRLNVLRALATGPNATLAGVESVQVIDSSGDGIIEPGEAFDLHVDVRNYLRGAPDVALRIAPVTPPEHVTIIAGDDALGALGTGESRSSVRLRARAAAWDALDWVIRFRLAIVSDTTEIGWSVVEIDVNPNYSTTTSERVTATLTGNGRIGFNDFPNNEQGIGFRIGRSDNLLAEGGLLIGTSPSRLADVVRSGDPGFQSQGLQSSSPYRVSFSDEEQAEVGVATFNDQHLHPMQRNGLSIALTSYAYRSAGRDNQILLFYRIANTSEETLERLHCALYLDWDIGIAGANNQARLDPENRLGYTFNVYTAGMPYTGAMLVGDQPMNFYAADNGGELLGNGFFQEEKWEAISSGIRRDESSVGDCSIIVGAGPITLAPGDDTTIVFSLMAGEDLASLRMAAAEARAVMARFAMPAGGPLVLPTTLELVAGTPNPFTRSTRVDFTIPAEGKVAVDVFNAIGERVATLADGIYPRGVHSVEFAPDADADDQIYFVRLNAGGETMLRKLVRLRTAP